MERGARRIDIGLMRAGHAATWRDRFYCVIEVKKYPVGAAEDLRKIFDVLERIDSVLYAYLVIYFQRDEGAPGQRKTTADLMDEYMEWVEGEAARVGICAVTHTRHRRLATTVSNNEGARWEASALIVRFARHARP